MLVYWKEEDCVSVVPLRDIVDPCPLVTNQSCTVQTGKNTYYGLAVQMGTLIVTIYVRMGGETFAGPGIDANHSEEAETNNSLAYK